MREMVQPESQARNIKVLQFIRAVRGRPAMYLGSRGVDGLRNLLIEGLVPSYRDILKGFCNAVEVRTEQNGMIVVSDNARPYPIAEDPETGEPWLQKVLTWPHDTMDYKDPSDLMEEEPFGFGSHGVGLAVVNAASELIEATTVHDGRAWSVRCEDGIPRHSGWSPEMLDPWTNRLTFRPSKAVFETMPVTAFQLLCPMLRQLAICLPGCRFSAVDTDRNVRLDYFYPGGPREALIHDGHTMIFQFQGASSAGTTVEAALAPSAGQGRVKGYVNCLPMDGGSPQRGLELGIRDLLTDRKIMNYLKASGCRPELLLKHYNAIIVTGVKRPGFEQCGRQVFVSDPAVEDLVRTTIRSGLPRQLLSVPDRVDHIGGPFYFITEFGGGVDHSLRWLVSKLCDVMTSESNRVSLQEFFIHVMVSSSKVACEKDVVYIHPEKAPDRSIRAEITFSGKTLQRHSCAELQRLLAAHVGEAIEGMLRVWNRERLGNALMGEWKRAEARYLKRRFKPPAIP